MRLICAEHTKSQGIIIYLLMKASVGHSGKRSLGEYLDLVDDDINGRLADIASSVVNLLAR